LQNYFFSQRFLPGEQIVSENEVRLFYENYKWAFRRNFTAKSEYYSFIEVEGFIYDEIRRLKSYGLEELVNIPPRVEIIWQKEEPPTAKRGRLDSLPQEEVERRRRVLLASQPLKELFTSAELKELFTEPDYAKITNQLELSRAYDWFGKYPEALVALEKAPGMEAKFELGRFLKYGRPKIPGNKKSANKLFAEIVLNVEAQGKEATPEDICLAGRACYEYIPENYIEKKRWKKQGVTFFQNAIKQNYRPAYYYSQYYKRTASGKNPPEILRALPSDNVEINAVVGALPGIDRSLKMPRERDKNLAAVKVGVIAYNNVAQCLLGLLYLHPNTDPKAFLKHNPTKAKFWLQRAADRGNEDAIRALQNNPQLRKIKK
jgi:TPR repeat protein